MDKRKKKPLICVFKLINKKSLKLHELLQFLHSENFQNYTHANQKYLLWCMKTLSILLSLIKVHKFIHHECIQPSCVAIRKSSDTVLLRCNKDHDKYFQQNNYISNFINEIAVCFLNIEKQHYKLPEYLFTLIIFHNRMVEITYRIRRQELVEPMVKILKLAVQSHCT